MDTSPRLNLRDSVGRSYGGVAETTWSGGQNGFLSNILCDTFRCMGTGLSSRQRTFVGHAMLSLFVGWAVIAQQTSGDKSKTDIPQAGVNGVSMPKCEYCPDPDYSSEAKNKKYQSVVVLVVVVTPEGKATNVQVIKSPGLGLDEMAVEAVRKWRFKPATGNGIPVAAKVPIEVTFHVTS